MEISFVGVGHKNYIAVIYFSEDVTNIIHSMSVLGKIDHCITFAYVSKITFFRYGHSVRAQFGSALTLLFLWPCAN